MSWSSATGTHTICCILGTKQHAEPGFELGAPEADGKPMCYCASIIKFCIIVFIYDPLVAMLKMLNLVIQCWFSYICGLNVKVFKSIFSLRSWH